MKIDRTNYEPLVDAFKKGWHEADDEGDVGNRVRRGVRALLDESNSPQGIRRWAHAVKANSALIDQLEEAKAERAEVERAAAEKLEAELEARIEDRDYWYKIATEAKDQRDAALSAIAKVEGLHQPFEWSFGFGPVTSCKGCADQGVPQENASWPCPTIRALGSVPSTGEGNE